MKIISKSEAKELGLKRYFTGKPCKHGHIAERKVCDRKCIECSRASDRKRSSENRTEYNHKKKLARRRYVERNKSELAETWNQYARKYYKENKEELARKARDYREKNQEKIKEYRNNNKEKIRSRRAEYNKKNKESIDAYNRYYRENNPEVISENSKRYAKENPHIMFLRNTLRRIERRLPGSQYESYLGYTKNEFINHIESQFKDGMSWDNRSEWHIDHIKPIIAFIKEGVTDIKVINALSNLQPLWAKENLSKGSKTCG